VPVLMYVPLSCMHLMPRAVILWMCSMAFCVSGVEEMLVMACWRWWVM